MLNFQLNRRQATMAISSANHRLHDWHRSKRVGNIRRIRSLAISQGDLLGKALWTMVVCGLGMGPVAGSAIGLLVMNRFDGIRAIAATATLSVGLLGVGCNAFCFSIDRHLNHFGAADRPALWLGSGVLLSLFGGVVAGALLFTARGRSLLEQLGI